MIQDILPMKLHNEFVEKKPGKSSRVLSFKERTVYLEYNGEIEFLTYGQLEQYYEKTSHKEAPACVFLFSVGEEDYFLTQVEEEVQIEGFTYYKMFDIRGMKPKEKVFAAATAWHLFMWYRDNQCCGRCGSKLVHSKRERMLYCEKCNNMVFPKVAPAVIVGVTDGDKILMTKYADREYKRYALIAGFTEIGETAEETVHREVQEEVGLKVKNVRYYKSQPWGFDSNLLMGFFCDLDDDAQIKLDEEELAVAEWIHYRDIPDDNEGLSLTREMMTKFRDDQRGKNQK